jgi:hypothetical protein
VQWCSLILSAKTCVLCNAIHQGVTGWLKQQDFPCPTPASLDLYYDDEHPSTALKWTDWRHDNESKADAEAELGSRMRNQANKGVRIHFGDDGFPQTRDNSMDLFMLAATGGPSPFFSMRCLICDNT